MFCDVDNSRLVYFDEFPVHLACPLACDYCSAFHIDAAPTISPSPTAPTPSPSGCLDESDALFKLDNGNTRGCSWLTKNKKSKEERMKKYCNRFEVKSVCRSTCTFCECKNDNEFSWELDNVGREVGCKWLKKNKKNLHLRRARYCYENEKQEDDIWNYCPKSCGFCNAEKADGEGCRFNAQCASRICNDKTSKCGKIPNGQYCEYDDQCIVDKCNSKLKICGRAELGEECYRDSDCLTGNCCGEECEGGSETPYYYYLLDDGEPCGAATHCRSGVCSTNSGTCEPNDSLKVLGLLF